MGDVLGEREGDDEAVPQRGEVLGRAEHHPVSRDGQGQGRVDPHLGVLALPHHSGQGVQYACLGGETREVVFYLTTHSTHFIALPHHSGQGVQHARLGGGKQGRKCFI